MQLIHIYYIKGVQYFNINIFIYISIKIYYGKNRKFTGNML